MQLLDSPIFELSPIAMWLEDFSEVQKQFDLWRSEGVEDIASFLLEDKSRILSCAHKIKVLHVNPQTLKQFEAQNFEDLTANLAQIFKADMSSTHLNELVALWNGETLFENTAVNYTLTGHRLDIRLRGTVLPGHEHDLSLVLITTEDITPYTHAQRLEEKSRLIAEARFQYSPTSLWVEDFSRVDTADRAALVRCAGIAVCSHHDGQRIIGKKGRRCRVGQFAARAGHQQCGKVAGEAAHQHLTFGVAKAGVIFDQLRTFLGQHQPREQHADIGHPLGGQSFHGGADDAFHHFGL